GCSSEAFGFREVAEHLQTLDLHRRNLVGLLKQSTEVRPKHRFSSHGPALSAPVLSRKSVLRGLFCREPRGAGDEAQIEPRPKPPDPPVFSSFHSTPRLERAIVVAAQVKDAVNHVTNQLALPGSIEPGGLRNSLWYADKQVTAQPFRVRRVAVVEGYH